MNTLSFDHFTRKIFIKVPVEKLYWCWSTEDGLTSWFLRASDFIRAGKRINHQTPVQEGDEYLWMWHNWDGEEKGVIRAANEKDHLQFSFAGDNLLDISLHPKETGTLLILKQSGIPTDEESKMKIYCGCSNGWTFWLTNLKAFLEHGILLNETTLDLRDDPNAAFEYVNI
ncbi:SRPBCC family protein [Robertkochia flava]|uniref:SRPBCC family protein n=1 Tax=Robertkochia flava TaxID=3447986 RepID=UPI001CC939D3|nr:SRPBCC domain-containing protein [Robertkochia marina]